MKEILNIENFGIMVNLTDIGTYQLERDSIYAPMSFIEGEYETLEEVLGEVINYILNPNNVYAFDELPEYLQKAYQIAGVEDETSPVHPEITNAVSAFLDIVLEGIAYANMRQ